MVKELLPYLSVLVLCIVFTALITARIVRWREEMRLGEFQNLILKKQREEEHIELFIITSLLRYTLILFNIDV